MEGHKRESAGHCRRVSESVQKYSVQYKGYNLIAVTTVVGGATRGTTELVYSEIHMRLYRGYVQVYCLGVPYPRVQNVHAVADRTSLHILFISVQV